MDGLAAVLCAEDALAHIGRAVAARKCERVGRPALGHLLVADEASARIVEVAEPVPAQVRKSNTLDLAPLGGMRFVRHAARSRPITREPVGS